MTHGQQPTIGWQEHITSIHISKFAIGECDTPIDLTKFAIGPKNTEANQSAKSHTQAVAKSDPKDGHKTRAEGSTQNRGETRTEEDSGCGQSSPQERCKTGYKTGF